MTFDHIQSILIVKLSSIGDVVQSLPVAAAVRRRFSKAYIAWAVKPAASAVVEGNPHLDETLVIGGKENDRPRVKFLPSLGAPVALARALRVHHFDLALDLQGLFKSALIGYLSGACDRIGYRNLQEGAFLLNNRRLVPDRRDIHAVDAYLQFAELLGAPIEPVDFTITTSTEDKRAAENLLGDRPSPVAFIPGARWESKRWPPARFASVANTLAEEFGCTPVIVGGPEDGLLAQEIAAHARCQVLDFTGQTTLKQLVEVFRRCGAAIANDTGPMYISAAVGIPTIAIFGPTDANRLGPYGISHAKLTAHSPCAPCRKRRCPNLRCMEAITSQQVLAVVRPLLMQPVVGGGRVCS